MTSPQTGDSRSQLSPFVLYSQDVCRYGQSTIVDWICPVPLLFLSVTPARHCFSRVSHLCTPCPISVIAAPLVLFFICYFLKLILLLFEFMLNQRNTFVLFCFCFLNRNHTTRVQTPAQPLPSSVTLGKSFDLSVPQLLHL